MNSVEKKALIAWCKVSRALADRNATCVKTKAIDEGKKWDICPELEMHNTRFRVFTEFLDILEET